MDFEELVSDLEPVTRWFDLGLQLGLSPHQLYQLKSEQICVEHKRMQVLVEWIRNCRCPTWLKVVGALVKMDEMRLANLLAYKHGAFIESMRATSNNSIALHT